jgi:hypothetical protein
LTRLGEAGCTENEIGAITGHRSDEMMARAAIAKFEEHRRKP